MPEISDTMVKKISVELQIPPERENELHKIFKDAIEQTDKAPIDDLKTFIKTIRKANELAFLCFMYGINIGGLAAEVNIEHQLPGILNQAANFGAKTALERAHEAGALVNPAQAKKKDEDKDEDTDPMYR